MFRRIPAIAPPSGSQGCSPGPTPLVLIVAYRADDDLMHCLDFLASSGQVLVVDNDASPATRAIAEAAEADYLPAPANLGFAGGVNAGLRESWDGHSDVLLLNPDARVSLCDLQAMSAALHEQPGRMAALGPRLIGADGSRQAADWPLPAPGQVWFDALGMGRLWRGPRFVVGAALLLDGTALAALGGLDERYFLYAEEADWQLRAHRAGWDVGVLESVTVVHSGGASSADDALRDRQFHTSGNTFAAQWYGPLGRWVMRAGSIVAAVRRSVIGTRDARRVARRTLSILVRPPSAAGPS